MSKPLTKYTFDENGNYRRKDRFYMPDVDGDTFYKASDVDDRLRQRVEQVVQYSQEAADLKAQLREESQFSLERQGIIDGLRSERSRHTEVVDKLRSSLAAMTAERDEWQVKARWKHTHDESLECELQQQLAAALARCVQLENVLRSILHADERGQGLPFSQAMDRADKLLTSTERPPA